MTTNSGKTDVRGYLEEKTEPDSLAPAAEIGHCGLRRLYQLYQLYQLLVELVHPK